MRCKLFSRLLFAALAVVVIVPARAQEPQQQPPQDEEVLTRGAFLTTRPKTATKETPPPRAGAAAGVAMKTPAKKNDAPVVASNTPRKSRKGNAVASGKGTTKKSPGKSANDGLREERAGGVGKTSGGRVETGATADGDASQRRPIGLGYTFFTLGDNGLPVRTDSARQFRTGEALRISLEANTDGYLYIFHTENDGEPTMIFPDARLNGGSNLVRAHVPYEIPSSEETREEMRWFVFKDPPAAERLYIILARQPLAGVPTGEALAGYCSDAQNTCPWRPATAVWTELRASQEREQVAVSKVKDYGRAQTAGERDATTRGLGLSLDSPTPSVIRLTASADSKLLVTAIDLIHK